MFEGIAQRLLKEIALLVPTDNKVMVLPLPERQFSAWLGGSYVSSLHSFEEQWVLKQEYLSVGSLGLFHNKFIYI